MARRAQVSFTAGELSPALYGRLDFAKYQNGLATMENFFVHKHGGASNRPGTIHIGQALGTGRLIPFQFSVTDVYILEFTDLKMRIIRNDGYVTDPSLGTIVEITSPYAAADLEYLSFTQSADVMFLTHPDYAPRTLTRTDHHAWTFAVHDLIPDLSSPSDVVGVFSGTPGATARRMRYKVSVVDTTGRESDPSVELSVNTAWPWAASEYVRLYWNNLIDSAAYTWVLSSANRTSIRSATYKWTASGVAGYYLELAAGGDPGLALPEGIIIDGAVADQALTLAGIGADEWYYGDEDTLGFNTIYVNLAVGGDPDAQAAGYVEYSTGVEFYLTDAVGGGAVSGLVEPAAVFELGGEMTEGTLGSLAEQGWDWGDNDSLGYDTLYVRLSTDSDPNALDAGGITYRKTTEFGWKIYKNQSGMYGYIGETETAYFIDDYIFPSYQFKPQTYRDPFGVSNYPRSVALHEQRLWYAGSDTYPQTLWASQLSDFDNFAVSFPLRGRDSIEAAIASTQVNTIRHMLPLDSLILFTDGAVWATVKTIDETFLTPSSTSFNIQDYRGCHPRLQPLGIGDSALFAQKDGHAVRVLLPRGPGSYYSVDQTILSEHLVRSNYIKEWSYQQHPDGIIWCVRDDGVLLGFTYLPEQEIYAWHRHTFDGTALSVATIPGDDQDETYFLISRVIDGSTVYHVEKLAPRLQDDDMDNAIFLDDSLSYSGAATDTVSGLTHLEGETVAAMADGAVVRNLTVSSGSVTLPAAASTIHVGLPYTATMKTLPIEAIDASSIGLPKKFRELAVRYMNSREFSVGPSVDDLRPVPWRTTEAWGEATAMSEEGVKEIQIDQQWDRVTQVVIRVDQPVPVTILGISGELLFAGSQE